MHTEDVDNQQRENITIDDMTLVRQCQNGDSSAMRHIVMRYQNRIYNIILKICSNRDDAAELTQETFVKLIEKIDTFKGNSSFYTWLFRVAVNLTLNYCRRQFKISAQSIDADFGDGDDSGRGRLKSYLTDESADDPLVAAQNNEAVEIVKCAISKLDEDHRAVIVLREIEGMNYNEIAETLEVEIGTVKSRLSRARANLKEILEALL
ncbi:MAG: sigma-70 family RNA polymerase sigma factor [Anaerohalosphaera sp.]|nr:sigma-70 family RNA polymerase sigma factor [Anaerohalosphaera sp.]